MGTLTGNNISQTYKGLIKLADSTTGVTSVTQSFQDGLGNNIPIQVSQTVVNISGSLLVNGVPITGSTGSSGTSGTSGSSGINGTSGTSGISGTSGTSGTSGSSGSSGVSGTSGTSGSSGVNGTNGTSGSSGVNGTSGTSGVSGTSGTSGVSGTSGTSGSSGLSNSFFNYQAKTTITSGDPLSGHLIWNNATQTGSTSISLSELDQLGNNVDVFLGNLASGSTITIQDKNNHLNYQIWKIGTGVDNSTYWTFPVTLLSSTYSFSNNQDVLFIVVTTPSGTSGTSGTSGINGTSGTSGSSGSNGSSGTSGSSGSDGSSGTSGSSGSSGTSGINGSSGTSGSSGISGTSGTSGNSIFTGSFRLPLGPTFYTTPFEIQVSGSFVASGSNIELVGPTKITGSLNISGSQPYDLIVTGGARFTTPDGLQINTITPNTFNINTTNEPSVNAENYIFGSTGSVSSLYIGVYDDPNFTTDVELKISADSNGLTFNDWDNGVTFSYIPWMSIAPNIGNNPHPQFRRSIGITGSLNVSASAIVTGSVQGNVLPLSISSNTASVNLNQGNFFTLQLVSGSATHINPSNIKPGQTINILLNTTGSGTVTFPSSVKQVSGSSYVPTTTTGVDVVTLISFDSSSLYLANVKNLI